MAKESLPLDTYIAVQKIKTTINMTSYLTAIMPCASEVDKGK